MNRSLKVVEGWDACVGDQKPFVHWVVCSYRRVEADGAEESNKFEKKKHKWQRRIERSIMEWLKD